MKPERFLVATDFSAAGERAAATAAQWARRASARLHIVHVTPPKRWLSGVWRSDVATFEAVQQNAGAALKRLAQSVDPSRELELSTAVLVGTAARSIGKAVRDFQADLLVIGARGERETANREPGLGGTSTKLVAGTKTPLLLVRHAPSSTPPHVVAALDLSPVSAAVLEWARFAAAGGKLHAIHAYEVPFASRLEAYGLAKSAIDVYSEEEHARRDRELAALVESAGSGGSDVQRIVERGDPANLITGCVQAVDATLVVLGKHVPRARRASGSAVGSVCRYISAYSRTDVLVIPPPPGP